jgi:hypothetical protein
MDHSHDVKRLVILIAAEFVHGNDAGVFQLPGDLGFGEKSLERLDFVGANPLECDLPADVFVLGEPDFTHPAAAVQLKDPVAARPRLRGHGRKRYCGRRFTALRSLSLYGAVRCHDSTPVMGLFWLVAFILFAVAMQTFTKAVQAKVDAE